MKIITQNKQRECVARLIAIRRITDDMNNTSCFDNEQANVKRWADNMEYLADNILEIANIIGGLPAMIAIQKDLEKRIEHLEVNEHDGE
jgi:hypothetical protein